MNRSGLFVLGIMGVVALCFIGTLLTFDPRVKAWVAKHGDPAMRSPLEPGRKLHEFVADAGTR